jgi:hypothetical protein
MLMSTGCAVRYLPFIVGIISPVSLYADELKLLDAEAIFRERFKIPTAPFRRIESCLPFSTGGGMQAAKVPCLFFYVVKNIKVEKIKSVSVSIPSKDDVDNLPIYRDEKSFDIANCVSTEYRYNETLKYTTTEGASITYTQNYTNVQQFTGSWDVNMSLFGYVAGKSGGSQTVTATYAIGKTDTEQKTTTVDLQKPEDFIVPPMKIYSISYSDTKRRAHIPMVITAVFSAEQFEEIRALPGNVARATLARTINEPETEELRTFQVKADLLLQGSNRDISIKRTEKPCE